MLPIMIISIHVTTCIKKKDGFRASSVVQLKHKRIWIVIYVKITLILNLLTLDFGFSTVQMKSHQRCTLGQQRGEVLRAMDNLSRLHHLMSPFSFNNMPSGVWGG